MGSARSNGFIFSTSIPNPIFFWVTLGFSMGFRQSRGAPVEPARLQDLVKKHILYTESTDPLEKYTPKKRKP